MRALKMVPVVLFFLCLIVGIFSADKITPGGLVYAQAFWGDSGKPMTENRMKITVNTYPGDASAYFWSQQFFYAGSNEGGYVGIQTGGLQKGRLVGKQFIFSVWNVTQAEAGRGAKCEPFTGEGDGMKCSLVYDWKNGEEYVAIVRVVGSKLVGAMAETKSGKMVTIGKMPFAKGHSMLSHGSLIWVEYFGDSESCEATPLQRAVFTPATSGAMEGKVSNITFGKKCNNSRGDITPDGKSITFTSGGATAR